MEINTIRQTGKNKSFQKIIRYIITDFYSDSVFIGEDILLLHENLPVFMSWEQMFDL